MHRPVSASQQTQATASSRLNSGAISGYSMSGGGGPAGLGEEESDDDTCGPKPWESSDIDVDVPTPLKGAPLHAHEELGPSQRLW